MVVPGDSAEMHAMLHDAPRLARALADLVEAWRLPHAVTDRDARGWLGFCVLCAHVVRFTDPARPPTGAQYEFLRSVFDDPDVRRVVLAYYGTPPDPQAAGRAGDATSPPRAHRSDDDRRFLDALAMGERTRGLFTGGGPPADGAGAWLWRLHRIGSSALVLEATPADDRLGALAVKVIAPPYLQWDSVRAATRESSLRSVDCNAIARTHGSSEAMLVSEFVPGATLAEVLAARELAIEQRRDPTTRAGRRRRPYTEADGIRFARSYWLPVVRALATLDERRAGAGHGDLNPANVILRAYDPTGSITSGSSEHVARGLVPAPRGSRPQRLIDLLRRVAGTGPRAIPEPAPLDAVFVDLGPTFLVGDGPAPGWAAHRKLSRHTAPELGHATAAAIDLQQADLYSLGDVLLDAIATDDGDDGERIERVYRYSFELGQLVDTLRSHNPVHRTVLHRTAGQPFCWRSVNGSPGFVEQVTGDLTAAEHLGGTGLHAYSFLGVMFRKALRSPDIWALRTSPARRTATLGSRETWPIAWLALSRLTAWILAYVILLGAAIFPLLGCDGPIQSPLCPLTFIFERLTQPDALADTSVYRLLVLVVAVTWLIAGHLYYIRIFAMLRPRLCPKLRNHSAAELTMRLIAAPAYAVGIIGMLWPGSWWVWSGLVAMTAALNNLLFLRFLRSAVDHLDRHAADTPNDSLRSAARRITAVADDEYYHWWVLMLAYGLACVVLPSALLLTGNRVDWPLALIAVAINTVIIWRNCSESGHKAPEIRAAGARAIAGYLRIEAATATGPGSTAPG